MGKIADCLIEDARKEGFTVSQSTEKLRAFEQNPN